MKTIICIFIFTIFFCSTSQSQNITNIIGTNGVFSIKNGANTYLSLSQSNGNLNLSNSIVLPYTNSSTTMGIIFKGTDRFLHNYGNNNTFLGVLCGNLSMTGTNNVGVGNAPLYYNTTGTNNTAIGNHTLFNNTTGSSNTAIGKGALQPNTTGSQNTAIGLGALGDNITGSNNIGIGFFARVPSTTANNQVRIGDTYISYAGIQVAWSVTSDRRWKENILPSNLGLSFLSKLNPVSYTRINDESQRTEYGLIAQELEQILIEEGIENTGMITKTDEGFYELRYNDLLAPMIRAIQEIKAENDILTKENDDLKSRFSTLEESAAKLVKLESLYQEMYKTIETIRSGNKETINVSENQESR